MILEREFVNFDVGFFLRLLLNFLNIQIIWLLSIFYLFFIIIINIQKETQYKDKGKEIRIVEVIDNLI
jgi:hypothetical protein